jgi:hypothetical protein
MDYQWNLLTDASRGFGNALANVGQAIGQGREKRRAANALSGYIEGQGGAVDPALAKYYPQLAFEDFRTQQKAQREQQEQQQRQHG